MYRQKLLQKSPAVLAFDTCLKEHLAQWFADGFLDLNQISWDQSPAGLMEKVFDLESSLENLNYNF